MLERAIRSILCYPWDDIELIVQDNCSPDNTKEIIQPYLDDKRFRFYSNKENLGARFNVTNILTKAKGDYIFSLGDDDFLVPDAVDKIKAFILANKPNCFRTDLIIHQLVENKMFILSSSPLNITNSNHNDQNAAKIYNGSNNLTSLCFNRKKFDFKLLNKYGDNWYPSSVIAAYFCDSLNYLALPLCILSSQKVIFWGINPYKQWMNLRTSQRQVIELIKATKPKSYFKNIIKYDLEKSMDPNYFSFKYFNIFELFEIMKNTLKKHKNPFYILKILIKYKTGYDLNELLRPSKVNSNKN